MLRNEASLSTLASFLRLTKEGFRNLQLFMEDSGISHSSKTGMTFLYKTV
ncbi:hypothetical protein [Ekhidna sp.]